MLQKKRTHKTEVYSYISHLQSHQNTNNLVLHFQQQHEVFLSRIFRPNVFKVPKVQLSSIELFDSPPNWKFSKVTPLCPTGVLERYVVAENPTRCAWSFLSRYEVCRLSTSFLYPFKLEKSLLTHLHPPHSGAGKRRIIARG